VNVRGHHKRFKNLHKAGMSVTNVERGRFTSSNGNGSAPKMQGTLEHLPESLPTKHWLKSLAHKVSGRVVRKTDDGTYRISRGTAGIFISAFLGMALTGALGLLSQRDQITRLQTLQEVQEKSNLNMKSELDQVRNYVTLNDKNTARVDAKLDQFMQIYSIKNADKAQLKFSPE
jgi:hypothetical protein